MDYLLKSSALIVVFYLCYELCLRRETFFQSNRWFLLSGLIIAISIPFIVIPNYIEYSITQTAGLTLNDNTTNTIPITIEEQPFDYLQLFFRIYSIGLVFFFGKLVLDFLSLYRILKSATFKSNGKYKLMETSGIKAPFSFFNTIVYNPNQFNNEELAHVINHEKVHAQQQHSIDTIISQLTCVVFWFNPIVWLYKKALQQNLEFIADCQAQYISPCNKSYQTVLLKASVTNHHLAITNNFYTSLIKKRIIMLHKSKSNPLNQLKYVIILPLLALFMMSFNVKDVYVAIPLDDTNIFENLSQASETLEILITKDTSDDALEEIKQELKDRGITFTYSGIKRNKKGEITAITTQFKNDKNSSNYSLNGDNGIKPFRFVSTDESFSIGTLDSGKNSFIYETDDDQTQVHTSGSSSNVFVVESNDEDKTEDVKVKVKNAQGGNNVFIKKASGGTWISKDGTKTNINASENGNTQVFFSQSTEPIFIVNGKAVSKAQFEDVDSDNIKTINVLKGKAAVQAYGKKGKNGVVVMSTTGSKSLFNNSEDHTFFHIDSDDESPIYIVDGKVFTQDQIGSINPKVIEKVEVLKDNKAVKIYGSQAKNGAIIVTSKNGENVIGQGEPIIVELAEGSQNSFKTAITSVYYTDDELGSTEFIVTKDASNAFLDKQKSELKAKGINAKFSKVRRNQAGEITSIKISLDDNQGRKSSASWKEKDQAIPDIVLGKSGGSLFVRAIGN